MKAVKIVLIIFMSISFFSCKKTPPYHPQIKIIEIDDELKSYIIFPVGSYWVYEDSASLQVDSFYLKNYSIDTVLIPWDPYENFVYYYEHLNQSFFNEKSDNQTVTSVTYCRFAVPNYYENFYKIRFINERLYYPYLLRNEIGYISIYDTLEFLNEKYTNVLSYYKKGESKSYWCKDIGMIRVEFFNEKFSDSINQDTSVVYNLKRIYINH